MDYFSQSQLSSLSINDKTYDKIINHLDEFIKSLPEEKDKQLPKLAEHRWDGGKTNAPYQPDTERRRRFFQQF